MLFLSDFTTSNALVIYKRDGKKRIEGFFFSLAVMERPEHITQLKMKVPTLDITMKRGHLAL